LWTLNRSLGDDWLAVEGDTISLRVDDRVSIDAVHFQQRLEVVRFHAHASMSLCSTCLDSLSEAVNLYHNDFLAGFTLSDTPAFDEWQFFQGESLRQALVSALERLVSFHTAQGDYEAAIPLTRRRLALDSLHEPAHRQLMQLYEQTG
jgi:DNA-binding SARP family transcriptional activator